MTKNAERDIQLIATDLDGTLLTSEKALAPDEVKQAAITVAPSNEDEGVAWALKAYNVV